MAIWANLWLQKTPTMLLHLGKIEPYDFLMKTLSAFHTTCNKSFFFNLTYLNIFVDATPVYSQLNSPLTTGIIFFFKVTF